MILSWCGKEVFNEGIFAKNIFFFYDTFLHLSPHTNNYTKQRRDRDETETRPPSEEGGVEPISNLHITAIRSRRDGGRDP